MDLREKFDAAMTAVIYARQVLLTDTEAEIEAREVLKERETDLLAMPPEQTPINGKNAETRMAQLRDITRCQRDDLAAAEKKVRFSKLALEVALDARRNLESILRIEELEK